MSNYYDQLGITSAATLPEIKSAFKQLAKESHPDKSGKSDTERFVLIREAYEVLSDVDARAAFDRLLRATSNRSAAASSMPGAAPEGSTNTFSQRAAEEYWATGFERSHNPARDVMRNKLYRQEMQAQQVPHLSEEALARKKFTEQLERVVLAGRTQGRKPDAAGEDSVDDAQYSNSVLMKWKGSKRIDQIIWPEESVRSLLADYGKITALVIKRYKSGKGKAIVEFATLQAAKQSLSSCFNRPGWDFTMSALGVDGSVHKSLVTRSDFETVDEMNDRRKRDRALALAELEELDATM